MHPVLKYSKFLKINVVHSVTFFKPVEMKDFAYLIRPTFFERRNPGSVALYNTLLLLDCTPEIGDESHFRF